MRDWRIFVRQHLGPLRLAEDEAAEVLEEIAAHLDETYHSLLAAGLSEEEAAQRAITGVGNWQNLKRKIESARKKEPPMTKRVSQFWFPAFSTLFLAHVLLYAIQMLGPKPWISPAWGGAPRMTPLAVVYFAWLLALPFIGALGAYLSSRAGARPTAVFSSIAFPIFPYLAFFVIGLPITVMLGDRVAHHIMLPAFFLGLGAWVVLPAIALLAGGRIFRYFRDRLDLRRVANR
jgi:hypothetical protein